MKAMVTVAQPTIARIHTVYITQEQDQRGVACVPLQTIMVHGYHDLPISRLPPSDGFEAAVPSPRAAAAGFATGWSACAGRARSS